MKTSFQMRFVVSPEWTFERQVQLFSTIPGMSGELSIQPRELQDTYSWATGDFSLNGVEFVCVLSTVEIELGKTPAEINAIHNKNGETNTFSLRASSFVARSIKLSEEVISKIWIQLQESFLKATQGLEFKGRYMWEDQI